MKKKEEKLMYVKLSQKSIEFIKSVILPELKITTPISVSEICRIEDWIYELENNQRDEDGKEICLDDAQKIKLAKAQEVLAELMGIWGGDNTVEDFDNLNKRLSKSEND